MWIRKKDGTKVTFKKFLKLWWKGIQQVQMFKEWKKEVNIQAKIYNE